VETTLGGLATGGGTTATVMASERPLESKDWGGPAYATCRKVGSIARRFEYNRRRLDLSFKHHAEVASLPPAEADALLDWCEEPLQTGGKPRSARELRGEVSKRRSVGQLSRHSRRDPDYY
jgi:hypothetical protein